MIRLPIVDGIQLVVSRRPHRIGMAVPDGGSSCARCRFIRNVGQCAHASWVLAPRSEGGGGGSTFFPKPADEWCCDFYEQ